MSHSTTDNEGPDTPMHSSVPSLSCLSINSSGKDTDESTVDDVTCPWKGGTFIIRNLQTKLVIAIRHGTLGLFHKDTYQYKYGESSHWCCVENDGMWLGFYNAVTGTYIGHDDSWNLIATARKHRFWECFCVRQHPDGGHVILVRDWDGFLPIRAEGRGRRKLVVGSSRQEGTAWEFIRVGSDY